MYRCKVCGRRFSGGGRRDKSQVVTDYIEGKQTVAQLASKYGVNERTIRRDLKSMRYVRKMSWDKHVVIQMDTTYWGRGFGLMVIKDALRKKILWRKYVTHETVASYVEGVQWLEKNGFKIYGAVIDGMRGLAQALRLRPVVPVPSDAHRAALSGTGAGSGCLKGAAEPREQYGKDGEGGLCRCV